MVKNTRGGSGHKKSKTEAPKEVPIKDSESQTYGIVVKMLGNSRLTVRCEDSIERLGIIRGSIGRSTWFIPGMHILVSLRDFQDSKVDILHGYSYEDSKRLELDRLFAKEEECSNGPVAEDVDIDFI